MSLSEACTMRRSLTALCGGKAALPSALCPFLFAPLKKERAASVATPPKTKQIPIALVGSDDFHRANSDSRRSSEFAGVFHGDQQSKIRKRHLGLHLSLIVTFRVHNLTDLH